VALRDFSDRDEFSPTLIPAGGVLVMSILAAEPLICHVAHRVLAVLFGSTDSNLTT